MWYVRPAKAQTSLRVRAVWSEPCLSIEYSMNIKLLIEQHLELLSLKGGCTGSSESTLVKMPHCWKSHVTAQMNGLHFSELNHLCGTTLTNLTGVISSPDLDNDGEYENMMECSWIIKAVESHLIILQFLEINLEKNPYVGVRTCMDYVKVCYMYCTIVSVYNQEIPQSQTADKSMASQERATQQSRYTRKTN